MTAGKLPLVGVVLTLASATAHAQERESPMLCEGDLVGLLDVSTGGDVSKQARESFIANVEDGLRLADLCVVKNRTLLEFLADSSYVEGCHFGPCLSALYARTKVRLVILARISRIGSAYSLIVSLVDAKTGLLISQEADTCTVCTVDEALAKAFNIAIATATAERPTEKSEAPVAPPPVQKVDTSAATRGAVIAGVSLLGAGAAAGVFGALMMTRDHDTIGHSALGAGAGLALSGITVLGFSSSF